MNLSENIWTIEDAERNIIWISSIWPEVESPKNTATFKLPPREFPMNSATMKTDYSFPLALKSPTKLSILSQWNPSPTPHPCEVWYINLLSLATEWVTHHWTPHISPIPVNVQMNLVFSPVYLSIVNLLPGPQTLDPSWKRTSFHPNTIKADRSGWWSCEC